MKKKKNKEPYDWLGILKSTKERFLRTMRGNETQDSFLNKLLDLYDRIVEKKPRRKIK